MGHTVKFWVFKVAQNAAAMLIVLAFSKLSGAPFLWLIGCAYTYYAWQTLNDRVAEYLREQGKKE